MRLLKQGKVALRLTAFFARESIAYRAEMVIWAIAAVAPLTTALVFSAAMPATNDAEWTSRSLVAYFLVSIVVQILTSSWTALEIASEVESGLLSRRLLRPLHPLVWYACSNLGYVPLRLLTAAPLLLALFLSSSASVLSRDPRLWLLGGVALIGAWVLGFAVNATFGALSMLFSTSVRLIDLWFVAFCLGSGYLFPLTLLPGWLRLPAEWLPFRFQLAVPVEILLGKHDTLSATALVAGQFGWILIVFSLAMFSWRFGLRRVSAGL